MSVASLRLASVLSAWLTVLVLLLWSARQFGHRVALLASLVLVASFGLLHVHSGRTANPDALLTLLMLLVVVVLSVARDRPCVRAGRTTTF